MARLQSDVNPTNPHLQAITERMNTNEEPRANQQKRLKGHHKPVFSARFLQLRSADKAAEAKRHGKIESYDHFVPWFGYGLTSD